MAEGNVAINPDSAAAGSHNVRTVQVTPSGMSPAVSYEEQQVVAIGDDAGNLVNVVDGGALSASDQIMQMLLTAIILRLDLLIGAVDKNYTPPDDIAYT